MINTYEHSSNECDCGILVNFNPVFSIIPPSGNGIAPVGATPNIAAQDTYILNFSVNSSSPSGTIIDLSPDTYTLNNTPIFIPSTTAKINSKYKINSQVLIKLVIKDKYNDILYTDYTEIMCLPDVVVRSGSVGSVVSDESGQTISVDSADLEVGMTVTSNNIDGTATILEIIDRNTIRINGRVKAIGTYTYKFTKSSCETITDDLPSYIYLSADNNWSYTYNGQLVAKFVPQTNDSNIVVRLTAKNNRLPSKNSFFKIPQTSLFKLVENPNPGNSSICNSKMCPSVFGQLVYDGDTYSDGDSVLVTYDGFSLNGSLKSLLTLFNESPNVTPSVTPSITPTITPTISITPTITVTRTPTRTPTVTPTVSITNTPTVTPTISITPTISVSATTTPTPTITQSITPTISITPTVTSTVTPTNSETPTPTPTLTPSRTASPSYWIYALGDDSNGEFGNNTVSAESLSFDSIDTNSSFVKFACGTNHTLAINSYGELYAWGMNSSGQLGDGSTNDSYIPLKVGSFNNWVDIATTSVYSIAMNSEGKVYIWGNSGYRIPTQILGTWKKISAGLYHLGLISNNNGLYVLPLTAGDPTTNPATQIGTNTNWVTVSVSDTFIAAINSLGQLFNGQNYAVGNAFANVNLVRVGTTSDWTQVINMDTNYGNMLFMLNSAGQIYRLGAAFGLSNIGVTLVSSSTDWTKIAGKVYGSNSGYIRVYGINSSNQLYGIGYKIGNGTSLNYTAFTSVGSSNLGWVNIFPGQEHVLGIVSSSLTVTPTPTTTPTISVTPTRTPTKTVTPTKTPTPEPSVTPTVTPTISETPTNTPTVSITPTLTPTISVTPTVTPTITVTKSLTPTITVTRTPTSTPPALAFVSTWNTTNTSTGSSATNQIKLPLINTGIYNFTVNWGDGSSSTITSYNQPEVTHTYATSGIKTITITGSLIGWSFANSGDRLKITNITSWGVLNLYGSSLCFQGCSNLIISSTDTLSLPSDCSSCFEGCSNLTGLGSGTFCSLNSSAVTKMSYMFANCTQLRGYNIGSFNTSQVTSMNSMFLGCTNFNQDISGWNTSNVTNMSSMFSGASVFNQNISSWDTSKVISMSNMFAGASSFDQNLSSWSIASIVAPGMTKMFYLSAMSQTNYHNLLIAWGTGINRTNKTNITFGISTEYSTSNSSAVTGRAYLKSLGWNIVDHGNQNTTILTYTMNSSRGYTLELAPALHLMLVSGFNENTGITFEINWGDGTGNLAYVSGSSIIGTNHTYTEDKNYDVRITIASGQTRFIFGRDNSYGNSVSYSYYHLYEIKRFGYLALVQNGYTFANNIILTNISALDTPIMPTGTSTSLVSTFSNCQSLNSNNINNWDISNVADVSSMFSNCYSFNSSLSNWNTSNIINMYGLFGNCSIFNQDISTWNFGAVGTNEPTRVSSMEYFLSGASSFSKTNYDKLLSTLATFTSPNATGIYLRVSANYSNTQSVKDYRNTLTAQPPAGKGWIIYDNGPL